MNLDFTGSTLFLVLLLFAAGLVCIIKGGDIFVDAATWIAEASGIPKFIIGATVVSFATTMPEMLVSVFSALEGNADIAVGNAVGSVTANTGLIMCLSLICMECTMPRRQYAVKAVLLLAAIAILFGFTRDGQLSILESVLILVIFVCFIAESLVAARREQSLEAPEQDARPKTDGRTVALNIGKFVFGAAAIVLGAQLLIDNGTALAQMLGVPDAIIGATMIAIGTSLPELVTTITAIRKKQSSLSVGNIIGANIMDLTLIMPLCALILGNFRHMRPKEHYLEHLRRNLALTDNDALRRQLLQLADLGFLDQDNCRAAVDLLLRSRLTEATAFLLDYCNRRWPRETAGADTDFLDAEFAL